jgi:hypothetical protein
MFLNEEYPKTVLRKLLVTFPKLDNFESIVFEYKSKQLAAVEAPLSRLSGFLDGRLDTKMKTERIRTANTIPPTYPRKVLEWKWKAPIGYFVHRVGT